MRRYLGFFIIFLMLGVLFSCGEQEAPDSSQAEPEPVSEPAEAVTETEDLAPVEAPEFDEGLVTFFSGDVFILEDEEWWEVAIGDMLEKDDILKTEASSYCEIQFGDTAVVRVQENTEIVIRNVALTPGEANVNVGMNAGSVLAKVKKLGGDESVKIQTQTAVCGVRGTEFAVTVDEDQGTNLAVKEGAVAVLPSSVDVDRLKEKAGNDNAELVKIIEELEKSAAVVEANQEIIVDETTMEDTEATAKLVEQLVDDIIETAKAEESAAAPAGEEEAEAEEAKPPVIRKIDPAKLASLQKAIAQTKTAVSQSVTPPKEISSENTEKLREIDRMKIINIPLAAAKPAEEGEKAEEAAAEPEINLIKISLQVEPKEAVIELNGEAAGKGKFSGIYTEGEKLSFTISYEGYKEHSLDISVSKETEKQYKIQLAKLPDPEPEEPAEAAGPEQEEPEPAELVEAETPAAEKEEPAKPAEEKRTEETALRAEEKETEKAVPEIVRSAVQIRTVPADAAIRINGVPGGNGRFNGTYDEGTELQVAVQRRGYETEEFTISVGTKGIERTVSLKPKTVMYDAAVSPGKIVGSIVVSGGKIYAADSGGTIIAADMEGNKLWSVTTANAPNENSYPVISGGYLYFSGSKELVIVNAANGSVASRTPLDANSAHLFGRRIVPSGSGLLLPTNESIRIINAVTGAASGEIALPKGSRMTPAAWNNKIVIADQQGSILILNPNAKNPVEAEISTAAVQPVALAPTIFGSKAVFSGRKGTVVCIDLASKQVAWEKKLPGGASVFNDIAGNGTGVYAYAKGTIYGMSLAGGGELFQPVTGVTSPPLCSGPNIIFGAGSNLIIRNASNGAVAANINLPGRVTTQPYQAGELIIVGTEKGHLLYIHP